jgi:hypothetical protein
MNCILCGSLERLDDRGKYLVCESCAKEQRECEERQRSGEVLDRDCSPLCTRCGLCCVVLSAEVKPSEVEMMANWSGRLPTEIAMVEERPFAGQGKLVFKRPCIFLMGKPTEYVSCRAYQTERPEVCGAYLCKLAIRYKAGACSLNEALFILRASVTSKGDIGMFNWSSDPEGDQCNDAQLAAVVAAQRALRLLNAEGDEADAMKLALFEQFHPNYRFASDAHETVFAAIMANSKGKVLAINQFFNDDEVEDWSDRDKEVALQTIIQVIGDISQFFVSEPRTEK